MGRQALCYSNASVRRYMSGIVMMPWIGSGKKHPSRLTTIRCRCIRAIASRPVFSLLPLPTGGPLSVPSREGGARQASDGPVVHEKGGALPWEKGMAPISIEGRKGAGSGALILTTHGSTLLGVDRW